MLRRSVCFLIFGATVLSLNSLRCLGQEGTCAPSGNSREQERCADLQLRTADADLRSVLRSAIAKYTLTGPELAETHRLPKFDRDQQTAWNLRMSQGLTSSQTTWLTYRESACSTVRTMYDTGTMGPVAVTLCKVNITKDRIRFLRSYFLDALPDVDGSAARSPKN
jgi:uncharacterized protein YecT (DUF1311 family)